jgi:hypothetical protein
MLALPSVIGAHAIMAATAVFPKRRFKAFSFHFSMIQPT